ncbi:MAG: metalloregulator ArsR/SmtB family transcription factor [Pseudomonadota bacterium]
MSTDQLSITLSALAHPVRRAILERLNKGDLTAGELAEPFDLSRPAVTKHLNVLERAGLIERSRDAQRRPCRLRPEPLKRVMALVKPFAKHWDESFDRLDDLLTKRRKRN